MSIDPETCSICEKPKALLMNPTEKQALPVYVCSTEPSKGKMPCDGWAFKVATKRT